MSESKPPAPEPELEPEPEASPAPKPARRGRFVGRRRAGAGDQKPGTAKAGRAAVRANQVRRRRRVLRQRIWREKKGTVLEQERLPFLEVLLSRRRCPTRSSRMTSSTGALRRCRPTTALKSRRQSGASSRRSDSPTHPLPAPHTQPHSRPVALLIHSITPAPSHTIMSL